ncbi:MAG: SsrA-binding protein SmpB [Gemmatimonadetes bacterium]|nr:SsrA-binding protein SmpB [Gemmatimonadota bacterium]NIR77688.1 SsrA-binding protein SmpB [Gemmatimonadota bacterium]NIT86234.1 SsrA-binding protein SmpB [Gemmatimonadota bacterium]NIU30059.1 SsrA-binding protein SmpB [Gemmatimonadota bacterium]NIU35014.1 SsrA-binding protein SmpB [Gemmatimonadota bacterium]
MADDDGRKVVARNRKARHEYEILETFEAGLVLKGPEVKSIREGKVAFRDSFARIEDGEAWLYNLHIGPYEHADRENLDPTRTRKLLLTKHEIRGLVGQTREKGLTLIPLDVHFRRGYAKVTLALARGRKLHDKREKLRRETMEREAERAMDRYR